MLFLFFVLSSLMGRLEIGESGHGSLSLGFVSASYRPLRLDLVRGSVSGSTPLENLEIGLSYIGTRS